VTAVIYYRESLTPEEEVREIARHFPGSKDTVVGLRDALVIGRYSVLPFYRDVEREFALQGSRLVNTYREHRYIADFEWYFDLVGMTPETWFRLQDVPREAAPFVLKGRTNSRKHQWNTHMYAADFEAAIEVERRLKTDSLIGEQDIIIRRFQPLRVLEVGINDLPFSNEWRFFFYRNELLSYGFYWTIAESVGCMTNRGIEFAREAARRVTRSAPFVAIDIAETVDGDWTVIEVNDGQMAGLSANDPATLYSNLARAVRS